MKCSRIREEKVRSFIAVALIFFVVTFIIGLMVLSKEVLMVVVGVIVLLIVVCLCVLLVMWLGGEIDFCDKP